MRRRSITALTVGIFVCTLAGPVYGQEPASGEDVALPDFSGVWGRTRLELEEPFSGPGPVTNTSEVPGLLAGDYNNPILLPWAADVVERRAELAQSGLPVPSPHNTCQLEGVPFVFGVKEIKFLQTPEQITLLYYSNHQVRHVAMNVAHSADPKPTWYGESVGHYEGSDTLVIDTIGIKPTDDTQVDRYGTPHTEALHVVERYRLVDSEEVVRTAEPARRREGRVGTYYRPLPGGKTLELQFTVEDQGAFTMPWGAVVHSEITPDRLNSLEHVCAENNRFFFQAVLFPMPTDNEPDF